MTRSEPLVECHDLSLYFGGLKAIDAVNFTLDAGELRCLIGPNGAGKTTFFRLLTGVHRPTAGTIRVLGQSISGMQTHQIAALGVGIKTQVPSLYENLTVRENIWLSARRHHPRREADRIADCVLEEDIALSDLEGCQVAQLAHGQRPWVELGVVIAQGPELILLDEPAAGMTGTEIERTAELIRHINRKAALIVVEQDMDFIRRIAKTVTVFDQVRVLIEAGVDVVVANERVRDVYLGKQRVRPHEAGTEFNLCGLRQHPDPS